jgi:RNA polymerase sigma-70 factor (ECF subfamily)
MALGARAVRGTDARAESDADRTRAFEAVYRGMLPRIYGYILIRVRHDAALAEDLTQETMLAYARAHRDGVRIANPTAWLFGTARFKVVDHYRGRSAQWETPIADEDLETIALDDAAELDRVIDRARLIAALDQLPDIQRLAILLRYAEGLSGRETATLLGKSEHAVESLLVRGRRVLRQLLTEEEIMR